jgi:hypothetical protein
MTRLLLLMLIAWLVWQGIERLLDRLRLAAGAARPERAERAGRSDNVETLVRCAGCGVHVSRSQTLTVPGGALVCSEECRRRNQSA